MQIEHYLFINSSYTEKSISLLLYPISILYATISLLKRIILRLSMSNHNIPIVSIGNISLGGSGKTPFLVSLIKKSKIKKYSNNTKRIWKKIKRINSSKY